MKFDWVELLNIDTQIVLIAEVNMFLKIIYYLDLLKSKTASSILIAHDTESIIHTLKRNQL